MRVIDLFSGVGGLSHGFVMSGFDVEFAIEANEDIATAYEQNHRDTKVYKENIHLLDVTKLKQNHGKVEIIIGGPPCQGFSQKGKRQSLSDERNFMYYKFIGFVEIFKPKYFLLENVPHILTISDGFFKREILGSFEKLGYSVDYNVLNTAEYGIPQERKRAFFLGKLGATKVELPKPLENRTTIKEAIYDLPFINSGEGREFSEYEKDAFSTYQKEMRKNSKGIYNHRATNHSKLALERLALIPKGKGKEVFADEE